MRKLVANTFITLDGVMQSPGDPEEDPSGGFKYGGWINNYQDEITKKTLDEFMAKPFELLLGRITYEIFAAYWPYKKNDPTANKFNAAKKYVVSQTLNKLNWNNSFLIKNNVEDEVNKLKKQDGPELHVYGSGNLIKTLINGNLVDELKVWIFPVIIGKGKKLFDDGTIPHRFKLIESKAAVSGVIIATYIPDGELNVG